MKGNIIPTFVYGILGILVVLFIVYAATSDGPAPIDDTICTLDARICPDGSAVGRTGPNCEFAACPQVEETPGNDLIRVTSPQPQATIGSPVTIQGEARGSWFFEANFPIVIVNWDGLIIGEGFATADGEWMTSEFVPFTATVSYAVPENTPYARGTIIIQKSNPSGLPEHDAAIEIPVTFQEIAE